MTRDDIDDAFQRTAIGSGLGLVTAPTDEQIRMVGERAALAILQSDPRIEWARYDHATQSIRVRLTAEASGSPIKVTIDEDKVSP